MLILILLAFVFFVMLAGGGYFAYTKFGKKDSAAPAAPAPPAEPSGSTLNITEDGASVTENYMIMPEVTKCHRGTESEMCNAYDKNDGFAFVYDLSLADVTSPRYESCPGGGHDCWYTEKYDEEGTLIAVTDKNGVSMLDKIADDIWSDKWSMESPLVSEIAGAVEFKDGSLVAKRILHLRSGFKIEKGDKVKPNDLPASLYFVALFTSMKSVGEEKPTKIILNVKGAKDYFEKDMEDSADSEKT